MTGDLAITNVPIDKRGAGNLDQQIDRWKRDKRIADHREAKALAARRREDKKLAKEVLAKHLDEMVAHFGPKLGKSAVREMLTSWARWEPRKLFDFVGRYLDEADAKARATDARDPAIPF